MSAAKGSGLPGLAPPRPIAIKERSSIMKVRTGSTAELSRVIDRIGMVEGVAGTETIIVLRTVKEEPGVVI